MGYILCRWDPHHIFPYIPIMVPPKAQEIPYHPMMILRHADIHIIYISYTSIYLSIVLICMYIYVMYVYTYVWLKYTYLYTYLSILLIEFISKSYSSLLIPCQLSHRIPISAASHATPEWRWPTARAPPCPQAPWRSRLREPQRGSSWWSAPGESRVDRTAELGCFFMVGTMIDVSGM